MLIGCRMLVTLSIVVGYGCAGAPVEPTAAQVPEPPPAASAPPSDEVRRADALIADMAKREAALREFERTAPPAPPLPKMPSVPAAPVPTPTANQAQAAVTSVDPIPPAPSPVRNDPPITVMSSSYAVTETNSTWSRFSWKSTLRNQTRDALAVTATIQFLDRGGFIVADDTVRLMIAGASYGDVAAYALIRHPQAGNVASARVVASGR